MFALPGLAFLVRRDLERLPGVKVTATGNDGRADILLCDVPVGTEATLLDLRSAEDVCVEIGRTRRAEGDQPHWIARRMIKPNRIERAMAVSRSAGPKRPAGKRQGGGMTYRVVARVLQEQAFKRTDLRRSLTAAVGDAQPLWRSADPGRVEVWAVEYARGNFVTGLRLSTAELRQHGGRKSERPGALRPTVAAAMIGLAGKPGKLLDPCCGSGTILGEAKALGWDPVGLDIDSDAVRATRRNVDRVDVDTGDARDLEFEDATFDASVSNLPFGRQYETQGDPTDWLAAVLGELARVTKPGGRVVLLVPDVPRAAVPPALRLKDRANLRLLGTSTTIWTYDRR